MQRKLCHPQKTSKVKQHIRTVYHCGLKCGGGGGSYIQRVFRVSIDCFISILPSSFLFIHLFIHSHTPTQSLYRMGRFPKDRPTHRERNLVVVCCSLAKSHPLWNSSIVVVLLLPMIPSHGLSIQTIRALFASYKVQFVVEDLLYPSSNTNLLHTNTSNECGLRRVCSGAYRRADAPSMPHHQQLQIGDTSARSRSLVLVSDSCTEHFRIFPIDPATHSPAPTLSFGRSFSSPLLCYVFNKLSAD